MWVTELVIAKENVKQRKQKLVILPNPEPRSKLKYLDIEGFMEREKMRRIKERK